MTRTIRLQYHDIEDLIYLYQALAAGIPITAPTDQQLNTLIDFLKEVGKEINPQKIQLNLPCADYQLLTAKPVGDQGGRIVLVKRNKPFTPYVTYYADVDGNCSDGHYHKYYTKAIIDFEERN